MPILEAGIHQEIPGITSATAANDRTCLVNSKKKLTVSLVSTGAAPTTGARLQYTNDSFPKIKAGTALWVESAAGNTTTGRVESSPSDKSGLTGVRAVVTDGTFSMLIRQK